MRIKVHRRRPEPWAVRRTRIRRPWAIPFWASEWAFEWLAFALDNWSFLGVLESLEAFSVLIAVIFYFSEAGDRLKQKHYQAWQVVNTAQGKGGSGGRVEALEELNRDGIRLVGVDASGAFLQGIHLEHATLVRGNLSAADVRDGVFDFADLSDADLQSGNFRRGRFRHADLEGANLNEADLTGADLSGADLTGATLANADLRHAMLTDIRWQNIADITGARISDVANPPPEFVAWAVAHGAVPRDGAAP
jgi:hypothetical protein